MFLLKKIKWIDDNENMIKLFFNINKIIYSTSNSDKFDFLSSNFKFGIISDNKKNNEGVIEKKLNITNKRIKVF